MSPDAALDARPISADLGGAPERPVRFRREFEVGAGLRSAELLVTALGVYAAELNGLRVGDHVLAPGWTTYNRRLRFQSFDVTDLLGGGTNCLGITVAEGWYRGRLGFGGGVREVYGTTIAAIAELVLDYGGHIERVQTDHRWRASYGPIQSASLYDGESVDLRDARPDWSSAGFEASDWCDVHELDHLGAHLLEQDAPPVRAVEQLAVSDVIRTPSGALVLDFGQNISGRLRLRALGPAGTEITIRHAEVLEDGELCVRPLRFAAATDRFILAGDGVEPLEPQFTIHGFRYAEVAGWPGDLDPDDVVAVVCHSDLQRTGTFHCSDPLLNKFHDNVVWSMRGNIVSVPTDCPQRDERLGWTGDLQVFAPTACFLYDCREFVGSWMEDLAAEQSTLGTVPPYVPWVQLGIPALPAAAWGDAAVIVPWVLYERYGDLEALRRQYPAMRAWVDEIVALAGDDRLWNEGFQFGDWLDPAAPPARPADARTDPHLIATAYHAYTARLLGHAADALGLDEAAEHHELADAVAEAFNHEYVTPRGRLASDAPTAYAVALAFDLLPDRAQRQRAAARLAQLVELDEFHIGTGFVGTPLVCDALSSEGYVDHAYHLLMRAECPSWLYPVTMGATTIWERWDSMLPDGSVNTGEMTSFNHYALGAVADFLHRVVAGLAPAEPGYRSILVRPRPGGGLISASASLITDLGRIAVSWRRDGESLHLSLSVPEGATAQVDLDGTEPTTFGPGDHEVLAACRAVSDDPDRPARRSPFDLIDAD